jgi:serine/threonine-protein kinase
MAIALTHPAICTPIATGIDEANAYLVQEYVVAESLDTTVRENGPARPADALRVVAQLSGALDCAADAGVHHGVLHSRDILLSSDETRLTGLGVAQALESIGVPTPLRRPYAPPERIAGAPWDRRADVFSLAALMHEMLWARRATGLGAEAAESLTGIVGGDLDRLRAVFARALAENRDDRYATALDFSEGLAQAFPDIAIASTDWQAAGREPAAAAPARRQRGVESHADEPRLPLDDPEAAPERAVDAIDVINTADSDPMLAGIDRDREPIFDNLELRQAEAERYSIAEDAPAIVDSIDVVANRARGADDDVVIPVVGAARIAALEREPLSALERSRSAIWPLVLALGVGVALGFGAGYGVGTRVRSIPPVEIAAAAPAAPGAGGAAAREWTEGAVAGPAKPETASTRLDNAGPDRNAIAAAAAPTANRTSGATDTREGLAERRGRLLVRSTPAGARVFVDGREQGRTPMTVDNLARGAHRLRVMRDGFAAEERRVTITSAQPAPTVTVTLAPSRVASTARAGGQARPAPSPVGRSTGALSVISRPAGAKVFVDGRLVGSTPLSLPALAAGEHAIHLERDGYRRWSSSVRVAASEQYRVTASLER